MQPKHLHGTLIAIPVAFLFVACNDGGGGGGGKARLAGTYCLNLYNMQMTIVQTGNDVTFTLEQELLVNGAGTINGDTVLLTASTPGGQAFTCPAVFSADRQSFAGVFQIAGTGNEILLEGLLQCDKGECVKCDIETNGIPQFVGHDFTELSKIEEVSKFRSGFGHSFTDGTEECRSMKHYYNPYATYRENKTVEVYSPVKGTIALLLHDGDKATFGLSNKEIEIKPDDQPAFTIVLYHIDVVSSEIQTGKRVEVGELIGHGRLYYEEEDKYVTSFDIGVWVSTPSGLRLIPYFEVLQDVVFDEYISRGAVSRQDFTITKEARDADPLSCDGEEFLTSGNLENWVTLD